MKKIIFFLIIYALTCLTKVLMQTSPYGNTCSCSGYQCGNSGQPSSSDPCWYNCCWQTMSLFNLKFLRSIKLILLFYFILIKTKVNIKIGCSLDNNAVPLLNGLLSMNITNSAIKSDKSACVNYCIYNNYFNSSILANG